MDPGNEPHPHGIQFKSVNHYTIDPVINSSFPQHEYFLYYIAIALHLQTHHNDRGKVRDVKDKIESLQLVNTRASIIISITTRGIVILANYIILKL